MQNHFGSFIRRTQRKESVCMCVRMNVCVCQCMCVCMCMCMTVCVCVCQCVCVCVFVCVCATHFRWNIIPDCLTFLQKKVLSFGTPLPTALTLTDMADISYSPGLGHSHVHCLSA